MKKVTSRFEVSQCNLYKLNSTYLTEKPSNTKIRYYLYDEKDNVYIGILKRNYYLIELILVSIIIFNMVFIFHNNKINHLVNISDTIYCSNDVVGLNIKNDISNKYSITIMLTNNGTYIINPITLEPGNSLGNVKIDDKLPEGSYLCKLHYVVNSKYFAEREEYEILLVVK